MEKENSEEAKKQNINSSERKITRKEAIKKAGYAAVSTATMMVLLNGNAQAMSGGKFKNWGPSGKKSGSGGNCDPQTS